MELGTHVQVWMFPGRAWDKEDTGSVWTWLMGWGGVVLGIVKTCSDGALDGIWRSFFCFLRGSCMFVHRCLSHMQS